MPTMIVAAIGLTGVAASIATALIGFAISYAVQSLFAPDEPDVESQADQGVSARIPTDPKNKLPVVYGEQRVAGQSVFADISSNNQTMYFIIALCEGPVEDITTVTWENKVLTFDGGLTSGLRNVTNAKSSNPNDETEPNFLNGKFRCQVFLNGGDCTPLTASKSSRWNNNRSNRTFPNTAYAYVELDYNREDRITGLPGKLYFTVKGRTVKTLSGTTLSTSTTMSTNPVDNLIDYMTDSRYGCGLKDSDLDLASFDNHKTFCNGQLPFQQNSCVFPANSVTASGGSTAIDPLDYNSRVDCEQATFFVGTTARDDATWTLGTATMDNRYTTNGILNTNNELDRNLSDLTVGNGGVLTYNLGKFGIVSQGTQDVVQRDGVDVFFSEDNIIGKLDITGSGFDAVLNEVTAKFTSKRQLYQQEQAVVSFDSVSETDTNTIQNPNEPRLEKTIQFPFTNNVVEARRLGRVIINDSRQALIVSFQSNIDNTDLQAGDIVEIAHATPGWPTATDITAGRAGKLFRVQQVDERIIDKDNSSIGVSIIAREYAAGVYNSETLLLEDPAPNTNLPNPLVTSKLSLVTSDASGLNDKGIPVNRLRVDWSQSADLTYVNTVDVRIYNGNVDVSTLADSDWEYYSTTSDSLVISDDIDESAIYQIQARPRNTLGALGVYAPLNADKLTPVGRPAGSTTLNGAITTSSTVIILDSVEGFPTSGELIVIDGDIISYTGISGLTLTGVTGIDVGHLDEAVVSIAIDLNGAPVLTASLDSIFEVEVLLTSNTGGSVFKNGVNATEKQLTATVTKVTETDANLAAADTFNYLWKQDGGVICIDSSKNVVAGGAANLDLSFAGPQTFTQNQCESAGGTFTAGTPNTCTVGGNDIGNAFLGCTTGDRADTLHTGYTLGSNNLDGAITAGATTTVTVNSTADFPAIGSIIIDALGTPDTFIYTSITLTEFVGIEQTLLAHDDDLSVGEVDDKTQTIIVQHDDVTESSGFSCEVSNIELTQT